MSFVEVFATGKIERGLGMRLVESNGQKPFCESWSRDQGIASELWKSKDQDARLQFDFWHIKNQAIKSFRREWLSDQVQFFSDQNFDPGCKCFNMWHVSDYPLQGAEPDPWWSVATNGGNGTVHSTRSVEWLVIHAAWWKTAWSIIGCKFDVVMQKRTTCIWVRGSLVSKLSCSRVQR